MNHVMLMTLSLLSCSAVSDLGSQSEASIVHAAGQRAEACRSDQSGIDWALPFSAARARAESQQRLLFIKPIAFGTSADGGW